MRKRRAYPLFFKIGLFSIIAIGPFVFFSIRPQPWEKFRGLYVGINAIYYPLEKALQNSYQLLQGAINNYINLHHTRQENEILKRQISDLNQKLISYDEAQRELKRLRSLLNFSERTPLSLIAVEILSGDAVGGSEPFRSLRVSKGSRDNIEPGMPVLTEQGLLGRVMRTGYHFADIQLLVDPNFNIDIILEHSRVRGILYGYNNSLCQMQLPRENEARIGDSIITSGLVGTYPKGIKIGEVVSISYDIDQIHQNILVQPYVNIREIEEAFIVHKKDTMLRDLAAYKEYKNENSSKAQ